MKKTLVLLASLSILSGCSTQESQTVTTLPSLSPTQGTSLSCAALSSTDMWRDPSENMNIVTTTKQGTDQLAISIEGETMAFNTRASVEAGMPSGTIFQVLQNNDDSLIAAYLEQTGYSMNTFVLNKKTGLAVWSKTRPEFPATDAPTADVIYLLCK